MDINAFGGIYRQIMALPALDQNYVGWSGPRPSDENPTQADLDHFTEQVIAIERDITESLNALREIDRLGSYLNLYYDAREAAEAADLSGPAGRTAIAAAQYMYGQAETHLALRRTEVEQYMQVLQAQLVVFAEARAKVEHDLRWQEYVAERFGADMSTEPRGFKFALSLAEAA